MAGPEYAKKTVAELQEILKSRSLPSSGKKADLIARLTEADKTTTANAESKAPAAEATISAPPDQTTTTTTDPTPATAPIPEAQADTNAQPQDAAPQQPPTDQETKPTDKASPDTTLAQTTYALHLPQSEVTSELAKRKARAERFGTASADTNGEAATTSEQDAEAQRSLERAKRFNTGQTAMGKLDEALPSEIERGMNRKRGRGADEKGMMDDPGLLRRGGGPRRGGGGHNKRFRGGKGAGGGSGSIGGSRPTGIQKSGSPASSAFSSEKDRSAAEARKKKFATIS